MNNIILIIVEGGQVQSVLSNIETHNHIYVIIKDFDVNASEHELDENHTPCHWQLWDHTNTESLNPSQIQFLTNLIIQKSK